MEKIITGIGIILGMVFGWCLCAIADKSDRDNGNK